MRTPTPGTLDPNQLWPRGLLLALAAGVAAAFLVVVAGLVLAVLQALRPPGTTSADVEPSPVETVASARDTRDAAAAAPLPTRPTAVTDPVELVLPRPSRLGGVGGVASGFPQTLEGAVAQLADLDQTVLSLMRPDVARATYRQWALPGGVGPDQWILTRNVESFQRTLARNGLSNRSAVVTATPAAGMVTATDGTDWVIACVLMDLRVSIRTEAQLGYGHCERMQWAEGRWQIGPGAAPTQPDPVTPGSADATLAGWRRLLTP